jgi:hypothetical protein
MANIGVRTGASAQSHSMIRSKNDSDQAETLTEGVARRSASVAGAGGGQPLLVALDVATLDSGEAVATLSDEVLGEAPQGDVGGVDGGRPQRQRDLIQVTPGRIHELGCPLGDGRPVGVPDRAGVIDNS